MTLVGGRCAACFRAVTPPALCTCGNDPAQPASPLILPPGTVLGVEGRQGEYRVGLVLGAGGFGVTYLGWHSGRNERVAIKEYLPRDRVGRATNSMTVRPHTTQDAALFQYGLGRFLQEAEALSQFNHPNIVRVLEFFRANETAYLVMSYYEGKTLGQHLDELAERAKSDRWVTPRLSPEVAVGVILGVLDGLSHVHRQTMDGKRWMHRDVKPDNILLRRDGGALLIDFGAARAEVGERSKSLSVVLTPGYAPPEQYFPGGQTQGPWVDVYGCAATLYHSLTGEAPVGALERYDAVRRGDTDPLKHPDQLVRGLPPELTDVVLQGLAIDYRSRPQDAGRYRELVKRASGRKTAGPAVETKRTPVRPPPVEPPRGNGGISKSLVAGIASVALLIGGAAYWVYRETALISVPNLIGKPVEYAMGQLAASKLALGGQESAESDATPGIVIAQSPAPGRRVESGTKVDLTVASEPLLEVPPLAGTTREQAEVFLAQRGFSLGKVTSSESADKPPGSVLDQDPKAGSRLVKGSPIDLVVAVKAVVVVPDLSGKPLGEAREALRTAGLAAGKVGYRETEAQAPGTVIGQTPAAQGKAEKGSQVDLVVAAAVDKEEVAPGWMGVQLQDRPQGVVVASVFPGSPAEKASIQPGDVILGCDGRKILSRADLTECKASRKPGTTLKFFVRRAAETKAISVTLGTRPISAAVPAFPILNNLCATPIKVAVAFREDDTVYVWGWLYLQPNGKSGGTDPRDPEERKVKRLPPLGDYMYFYAVDGETSGKRWVREGSKVENRLLGAVVRGREVFSTVIKNWDALRASPEGVKPSYVSFFGVKRAPSIQLCP